MKRILSILLSLMMIISTLPAVVLADDTAAADAVIYFTVSDRGVFASDNDGNIMLNKQVTVTDINKDGKLTVDEALQAAHKAYNTEDGYAASFGVLTLIIHSSL